MHLVLIFILSESRVMQSLECLTSHKGMNLTLRLVCCLLTVQREFCITACVTLWA